MKAVVISGLVLDASVALTWAVEDERSASGDAYYALARRSDTVVPALFVTELANALLTAERRARITFSEVNTFLRDLNHLSMTVHAANLGTGIRALALARTYTLTVYDATYLDLALQTGLPLATFDKDLVRAAGNAGVTLA